MKKTIKLIAILMALCVGTVFLSPADSIAATSKLKKQYKKAVKIYKKKKAAYKAAKKDYAKHSKQYRKGSKGFFNWVVKEYSGVTGKEYIAEDAADAVKLLDTTKYKKEFTMGKEGDQTDLGNMRLSVKHLKTLQRLRKNDDNFNYLPLPPVKVTSSMMARAQVQAAASESTKKHMSKKDGTKIADRAIECLAWGYGTDGDGPFVGWYTSEKKTYDRLKKYVKRNYNLDISKPEWDEFINSKGWDFYQDVLKKAKATDETGHYTAVCYFGGVVQNLDDTIEYEVQKYVIAGLSIGSYCHSLEMTNSLDIFINSFRYVRGISIEEYTSMFNKYYKMVYPTKQVKKLKKAKAALFKAKIKKSKLQYRLKNKR